MSGEPRSTVPAASQRVPDFFIVGHPKCGTTALYEMLRRHPQIFMPELKEPRFFASDMRQRFQPSRSGALPSTLGELSRAVRRAPPRAARRRGLALIPGLAHRRGAIAQLRPDARIIAILREPAELPALAAPAAAAARTSRPSGPAQGDLARGLEARRAQRSAPLAPTGGAAVLRPRALRRAAAPLPRCVPARAGAGADLRRLPRRQRGDGAQGAALSRRGRHRPDRRRWRRTRRVHVRSQQLDELVHRVSVGKGPSARAAKRGGQGAAPAFACAVGRSTRPAPASCRGAPARRTRR